jgi:hypothetical protein
MRLKFNVLREDHKPLFSKMDHSDLIDGKKVKQGVRAVKE